MISPPSIIYFLTVNRSIRFSCHLNDSLHIDTWCVNTLDPVPRFHEVSSTSAIVTFPAAAIIGLKFRAVLL